MIEHLAAPADQAGFLGLPFPGEWVVQGGAVGLLAFVALMIFMGWLVPSRTYRALERDRDYWREVALKSLGQTDVLLPAAQITTDITRALAGATGVHDSARPAPPDPVADRQADL